ncbi:MAG: NAD(P)-binding protein [Acidimicrobiia bacterium]|nr:NAD(P)-binding protein [Acidimicrobiia bacterium]
MTSSRVLIVGAGMAGLTAARELAGNGVKTVVLDKGRAVGGRMATRRIGDARFDHGAQHFGMRDSAFRRAATDWMGIGLLREWYHAPDRDGVPNVRHSAVGGMRRIAELLADGLDVRLATDVTSIGHADGTFVAGTATGPVADGQAIIVTTPVPQMLGLLDRGDLKPPPDLHEALESVAYNACLAVMARLAGVAGLPDGHLTPDDSPIAWIGDNEHKGTSPVPAVTIHSTPAFAADHLDEDPASWVPVLCDAAAPLLASPISETRGHRWRYAEPQRTFDTGAFMYEAGGPVVLAGEVFAGARIEGAFLSGRRAARALLDRL